METSNLVTQPSISLIHSLQVTVIVLLIHSLSHIDQLLMSEKQLERQLLLMQLTLLLDLATFYSQLQQVFSELPRPHFEVLL